MNDITLKNTQIFFVPSFSGNGWETSLLPRFDRKKSNEPEIRISFAWLKKQFLKMPFRHLPAGRQGERLALTLK